MNPRTFLLIALALILGTVAVEAYSGFPGGYYPGNQYGMNARFYQGPWGEVGVYGAHQYYPNWNGYQPYGFRTYGDFYTPMQLHYGQTPYGPFFGRPRY